MAGRGPVWEQPMATEYKTPDLTDLRNESFALREKTALYPFSKR